MTHQTLSSGRKALNAAFLALVVVMVASLYSVNRGREGFARSEELADLFLLWWAIATVVGFGAVVARRVGLGPARLMEGTWFFAIGSIVGIAAAATDWSVATDWTGGVEGQGPVMLTVPLLFALTGSMFEKTRKSTEPARV
ncbi:hypothetical protein ACX80C_10265 [Arthrobacter tecti]